MESVAEFIPLVLEDGISVQEIDRSVMKEAGLLSVVFDAWVGDKEDPAVRVGRYILVVVDDDEITGKIKLERTYQGSVDLAGYGKPSGVKVFEQIETIKDVDKSALDHQRQHDNLANTERLYGTQRRQSELYNAFMDAIDTLAESPDDKTAWKTVEEYRRHYAEMHEK
jgi:hypothetical protein